MASVFTGSYRSTTSLHKVNGRWFQKQFPQVLRAWTVENGINTILMPIDSVIKFKFIINPDKSADIGLPTNYFEPEQFNRLDIIYKSEQVKKAFVVYHADSQRWVGLWFDKPARSLLVFDPSNAAIPAEIAAIARQHHMQVKCVKPSIQPLDPGYSLVEKYAEGSLSWQTKAEDALTLVMKMAKVFLGSEKDQQELKRFSQSVLQGNQDEMGEQIQQWMSQDYEFAKHLTMNDFKEIRYPINAKLTPSQFKYATKNIQVSNSLARGSYFYRKQQLGGQSLVPAEMKVRPEVLRRIRFLALDVYDRASKQQRDYFIARTGEDKKERLNPVAKDIYDALSSIKIMLDSTSADSNPDLIIQSIQQSIDDMQAIVAIEEEVLEHLQQGQEEINQRNNRFETEGEGGEQRRAALHQITRKNLHAIELDPRLSGASNVRFYCNIMKKFLENHPDLSTVTFSQLYDKMIHSCFAESIQQKQKFITCFNAYIEQASTLTGMDKAGSVQTSLAGSMTEAEIDDYRSINATT